MGDVRGGNTLGEQLLRRGNFAVGHEAFATWWAPALTGSFDPNAGAFDGEFSFHLGKGSHDVEEEPTGRGSGIDLVSEGAEPEPGVLELVGERNQIFYASPQPVEFPDDEGVPVAEMFERLVQAGAGGFRAADGVGEDLLAAGVGQGVELQVEVLVACGDSGVADEHEAPFQFSESVSTG